VDSADAQIAEIRKKLMDYEALEKTLRTIQGEIATLKADITSLKEKENRTFSEVMRLEGEIRNCLTDEATAVEKQREIDSLSLRIRAFEFLEEAYEKIPFLILDNVIEIMEEEANRVLEEISTSGMRIELRTEKQNKNGKGAKDALDIIVSDVAGERRIELYSGGEKTRQILALAVGLAELSARKAGVKIETLLIDEPAGLDAQGLTDFGRCFIQLVDAGIFKKGILIAHESILKDVFEQKIIVTKDGTTSHVEITT
jgi:exonuclease SbcC